MTKTQRRRLPTAANAIRVLFVGNSYTMHGDVPAQVAALAAADPGAPPLTVESVAEGGATLKQHWHETGAADRIDAGDFTHVVLQDKSTQPLHDAEEFRAYATRLARLAQKRGASVLLFATWARAEGHAIYRWAWSGRGPAEMTRRLHAAYADVARELDATLAPVGEAWERARLALPELVLHDEDRHHASPLGSYLSACVLFGSLSGRDPGPIHYVPPGLESHAARAIRGVASP